MAPCFQRHEDTFLQRTCSCTGSARLWCMSTCVGGRSASPRALIQAPASLSACSLSANHSLLCMWWGMWWCHSCPVTHPAGQSQCCAVMSRCTLHSPRYNQPMSTKHALPSNAVSTQRIDRRMVTSARHAGSDRSKHADVPQTACAFTPLRSPLGQGRHRQFSTSHNPPENAESSEGGWMSLSRAEPPPLLLLGGCCRPGASSSCNA